MALMRGVTECQEMERENEQTRRFIWSRAERELGLSFDVGEGRGVAGGIPVCCVQAEVLTERP